MADDIVERLRSVVDGRQYTGPYWKYPLGELICDAIFEIEQLRAAGSPPPTPAPTRDDVRDEVSDVLGPWLANPDAEQQEDMEAAIDAMTDRVLTLLSAEPAPPLAVHKTVAGPNLFDQTRSHLGINLPVPPGTAVEVRAT